MIKIFTSILVFLLALPLFSQKVPVQVTKSQTAVSSEWQILDGENFPVIAGSEFQNKDSASFALEANKRYYFEVSVPDVYSPDMRLFSLYINGGAVLLIKSDIGPGDHFYSFFTGIKQDLTKITGGTSTTIADYPWQVFFESGNYVCGGSIISGDWIITAAHCTEDDFNNPISASQMDVIVGATNPRNGLEGQVYYVSKVIRHENYDPGTLANDIALLQLRTTINTDNATPIRLVSRIDANAGVADPGVMSWITGYGLTTVSPPAVPTALQQVQLPIVSNSQASTVWPNIPSTDLMAGYRDGNKDACRGDSGGPLVVPVDNEFKLAGIVSWGSSNCNTYGAYTRVSLYETWINEKTGIEISYTPPVPSGDSIVCKGVTTSRYNVASLDGVSAYEWQLLPSAAGTIQANANQADVTWTQGYTGSATIKLRVTKYNIDSYWSALTVHIAEYNNLISKSNDTIICAGQPVVLQVTSEGYNLIYSWFQNDTLIKSGSSSKLSLITTTTKSTGLYKCDISGSCGEDISPEINLTALPVTAINHLTPDTEAKFGDDITLEVVADGHNLLYQWQKDGSQIADGTEPEYSLLNVNASNTGLYRVMVSGTCGEVLSSNVYVYVTDAVNHANPEIFVWPTIISNEFNVALSDEQNYDLKLYSASGSLMKEKFNCQYKVTFSIGSYPIGVYILNVSGNNFRKSVKLIKN
jgi:secreted trypsin-like serine protease